MAKKVSVQYDHLKIPILGLVAENKSSAPSTPANGQIYYDTTDNRLYVRENGAFALASRTGAELLANKDASNGYAGLTGGKLAIGQIPTGQTGSTVPFGNDARFTDQRVPTDGSVTGGTAGAGVKIAAATITAANIANATITHTQVAAANIDGVAGTASLRTLGTGAQQAAAGNDARFTDQRTPSDNSVTSAKIVDGAIVTGDINAALKDAADNVTSLRQLGYSATMAMPGVARLDQIAQPTATVNLNGQRITGLAAPSLTSDAVRLADLQAAQAGIDNKPSARLVATTQRALTGLAAIDGVTPVAGDRVLLTGQTAPAENGIWVAASGAWARAADTINAQAFWMVEEGTTYGGSQWKVNTPDPIVVGTTALAINQWGAAGTTYTGTTNRVTVSGGAIDIAATYVGQTSITTLGTITAGTWTGTDIAVADGGTGSSTAAGARANLGAAGKYVADLGALTAGVEANVVHSLGTLDTVESFKILSDGTKTELGVRTIDANTIGVTADVAYAASAIRVTVVG